MYVHMHACIDAYVHMHACTHVRTCACMHTCMWRPHPAPSPLPLTAPPHRSPSPLTLTLHPQRSPSLSYARTAHPYHPTRRILTTPRAMGQPGLAMAQSPYIEDTVRVDEFVFTMSTSAERTGMVAVATTETVAAEAWAVGEGDDGCADAVDLGASIFSLLNPAQPGQTDEPCTMQLTREQRSQPSVPRREHLREQETWISHLPPSVARPMYALVAAPPCPPAAPAHAAGRGVPCACSEMPTATFPNSPTLSATPAGLPPSDHLFAPQSACAQATAAA